MNTKYGRKKLQMSKLNTRYDHGDNNPNKKPAKILTQNMNIKYGRKRITNA